MPGPPRPPTSPRALAYIAMLNSGFTDEAIITRLLSIWDRWNARGVFPSYVQIVVCTEQEAEGYRLNPPDLTLCQHRSFLNLLEYNLRSPDVTYTPSEHTGLDTIVQLAIISAPGFEELFTEIGSILEPPAPDVLYIFCRHGIHRSPAVAALIQHIFLRNITVQHSRARTRNAARARQVVSRYYP